jgi:competence protein ComEA
MKVAPDPVMSEVVRQRLELLLAEVRPRHAIDGPEDEVEPWAPADGAQPVADVPAVDPAGRYVRPPPRSLAGRARQRVLEFTREHLAAVVLVLVVGCGWTVYSLLQARSTPVAIAAVGPSVVASPTSTPSARPIVLVHVIGAVHRPGIVELSEGSRVADAVAAAGGLLRSADPGELNLAAVVTDGSQVVIGTRARPRGEVRAPGAAASGTAGSNSGGGANAVSLNTATLEQLDTLPGVGPVTAQKILDWRTRHGRFSSVSELQEVDGIGPKTYADLAPHVRV